MWTNRYTKSGRNRFTWTTLFLYAFQSINTCSFIENWITIVANASANPEMNRNWGIEICVSFSRFSTVEGKCRQIIARKTRAGSSGLWETVGVGGRLSGQAKGRERHTKTWKFALERVKIGCRREKSELLSRLLRIWHLRQTSDPNFTQIIPIFSG